MDNELMDTLINLKFDARAFQMLVDTILDNCRLGYDNESLVITKDEPIFAIIKAFKRDEYNNRFTELKQAAEEKTTEEA